MATPVWVNEGLVYWMKCAMNLETIHLTMVLFKNDATITVATVFGDLTLCDFSGYLPVDPSYGTPAYDSGDGRAEATASDVDFTHNGGGTANDVYGVALRDGSVSTLYAAMKFDAPITMENLGDTISVSHLIWQDQ